MTRPDDAAAGFREGFSSSKAVLSSFSEDLGLDKETARKISCGFGAGMAWTGNICGAVTGAIMVIGLKCGKATTWDDAVQERTSITVQEFITKFRAKNGSINCTELLRYDLRDPGQPKVALESNTVATKCPEPARDAAETPENILLEFNW